MSNLDNVKNKVEDYYMKESSLYELREIFPDNMVIFDKVRRNEEDSNIIGRVRYIGTLSSLDNLNKDFYKSLERPMARVPLVGPNSLPLTMWR